MLLQVDRLRAEGDAFGMGDDDGDYDDELARLRALLEAVTAP